MNSLLRNVFDRRLLARFWALARPYWFSEERRGARGLLVIVLLLFLAVTGLNVVINYASGSLFTALQKKEAAAFYQGLYTIGAIFVVGIPITTMATYVRNKLALYWRQWMTQHFLSRYFGHRAFYEINFNPEIDNPDQRIAQDIDSFTQYTLSLLLDILGSIMNLIAFSAVLWSISQSLTLVLVVYAVVGTLVTLLFGKKLTSLNFNQLRREADLRYSLVHVRDNAESIAFYQGEAQESNQIRERLVRAIRNFNFLIGWQRNLGFFTTGYRYLTTIVPLLVIAPLYLAGQLEFGAIVQASGAFSQIFDAISLIVLQFQGLTAYAAGIERLATFSEALEPDTEFRKRGGSLIDLHSEARIELTDVTLQTPNYEHTLIENLSFAVQPGQGLLIMGQSGCGKSSLLRAIAGLWRSGSGRIVRPEIEQMMFLPQRPYMPLGTLRDQLLYPHLSSDTPDSELRLVLERVNLANLPERVGGLDVELDWGDLLSLGEQQRLAFARLLLSQPRYAILDEATSALDLRNEQSLYEQLQQMNVAYVSVGHRASLLKYHRQVLEMDGESGWRVVPVQDYTPSAGVPL